MARGDINPYAPPVSVEGSRHAPPDRRSLLLRGAATIVLSCLVGAPMVSACAYALLELGLPPWSVRQLLSTLEETIDLHAGAPMVLNNLMLSIVCGFLTWPACWREQVSIAAAALVVLAVAAVAMIAALVLKVTGLYAIGGTEAVLLYEAVAAATIGLLLAVAFARRSWTALRSPH